MQVAAPAYLTPPQIARRLGVKPAKVIAWISRGELVASNVAESPTGRPRWRISLQALESFLTRRSAQRVEKIAPRRRRLAATTEYF